MKIEYIEGDLLDFPNGINVATHCANCQQTMASGIALQVKNRYPKAYEADKTHYAVHQNKGTSHLGTYSSAIVSNDQEPDKIIVNLYGQDYFGRDKRQVNYEAIYCAMERMKDGMSLNKHKQYIVGFPYLMACDRALIAKDVIQMLDAKKIEASRGDWVTALRNSNIKEYWELGPEEQEAQDKMSLQKILLASDTKCECCALGSILVSCVNFKNKVTFGEFDDGEALHFGTINKRERTDKTGIKQLFTGRQLEMIETAFEEGEGYFSDGGDGRVSLLLKIREKCVDFGSKYNSEDTRLRAIMRNIIKNNGIFIP